MLQLRKEHKTLVYGDYEEYMMESESVFLYKRWDEDGCYFILLNFTDQQQSIKSIEMLDRAELLISNYGDQYLNENILKPWEASVYIIK